MGRWEPDSRGRLQEAGLGALLRARFQPHHGRGDRCPGRAYRAHLLPALHRQTGYIEFHITGSEKGRRKRTRSTGTSPAACSTARWVRREAARKRPEFTVREPGPRRATEKPSMSYRGGSAGGGQELNTPRGLSSRLMVTHFGYVYWSSASSPNWSPNPLPLVPPPARFGRKLK
jgi:hypothetical protein